MKIVTATLLSLLSLASQVRTTEPLMQLNGKEVGIRSVQLVTPIRAYYPGAMGVSILSKKKNRIEVVKSGTFWKNLVTSSIPSEQAIDPYNLRVRIVLANSKQILIDNLGRFVIKQEDEQDFEKWTGPTRELRASQLMKLLEFEDRLD